MIRNIGLRAVMLLAFVWLATCCVWSETEDLGQSTDSKRNLHGGDTKPNFIVIHLDDVGYGDISYYSETIANGKHRGKISKSPEIDRLAQEGTAFSSYYASACVCTPSRAGILTGRYPIRTTVFPGVLGPTDDKGLPTEEVTIAKWLKQQASYRTFSVGKWHLGHLEPYLPTFHGFDKWTGMPYSHDFCPCPSSLTNTADNKCRYWEPACPLMNGSLIVQQPAILNDIVDYYVDALIEYMRDAVKDEVPFFAYYACHHTHHPQFVKKGNLGRSKEIGGRDDAYGDAVWEMDNAIGRIAEFLRVNNLKDNTYIFIASDNGAAPVYHEFSGSNSLLRCGKGTTWEGGQRVPFIVWGGKTQVHKVVPDIVAGMDLFPTISHLAGVPTHDFPRLLDGIDFRHLIAGTEPAKGQLTRTSFLFYSLAGSLDAVRVGKYKVHFRTSLWVNEKIVDCHPAHIKVGHQRRPLLYDLEQDPGETNPIHSNIHDGLVTQARQLINQHNCTQSSSKRACDASSGMHCYSFSSRNMQTAPWPPIPFVPWTQGNRRACCPGGADIVLRDWMNIQSYKCLKMATLHTAGACLRSESMLCNPSRTLFPQCDNKLVCARNNTKGVEEILCVTGDTCDRGWTMKYCPSNSYQCRAQAEDGGPLCTANVHDCQDFGGVAFTARTCGECQHSASVSSTTELGSTGGKSVEGSGEELVTTSQEDGEESGAANDDEETGDDGGDEKDSGDDESQQGNSSSKNMFFVITSAIVGSVIILSTCVCFLVKMYYADAPVDVKYHRPEVDPETVLGEHIPEDDNNKLFRKI